MKKTAALTFLSVLFLSGLVYAEDSETDEDALFGGETSSAVQEAPKTPQAEKPAEELLQSTTIEWGGSFSSCFTSVFAWTDYPADLGSLGWSDTTSFLTDLNGSLFFDARPGKSFRVFGKLKASYPFQIQVTPAGGSPSAQIPNIQVFELFSDFDWNDALFFRVGKHTIKWGVGYFFSPADVLNLTPIDPTEPTEEREGPVSLKVQYPLGVNSLSLFLIDNDITTPDRIGVAPKVEFVLGSWEIGIGGFYQNTLAPRAILMASGSLLGVDLFAEGVMSYGADKSFLRTVTPSAANPLGVEVYARKESPFFSGTAGFSWLSADWWNASIIVQYYYNGYGYDDSSLLPDALVQVSMSNLSVKDLVSFGKHYAAASAGLGNIADWDLGLYVFWMGNFSDGSGQVSTSVSWQLFDYATISAQIAFLYGADNLEFTLPGASRISVSLSATLGSGKF
jgi:hypothetical protein